MKRFLIILLLLGGLLYLNSNPLNFASTRKNLRVSMIKADVYAANFEMLQDGKIIFTWDIGIEEKKSGNYFLTQCILVTKNESWVSYFIMNGLYRVKIKIFYNKFTEQIEYQLVFWCPAISVIKPADMKKFIDLNKKENK